MFAQLSTVRLRPDKADEWIALTRDSILPAAKEMKGYIHAYLFVDREANVGVGLSLWHTKADIEAAAASGFYQEQAAKAASLLDGPPERQVLEVVLEPS